MGNIDRKNVPKLRFKDDNSKTFPKWEEKKLGDLGKIINGLTYSPNQIDSNGVLVLRSSNVKNNQLLFKDNVFVQVKDYNPVIEDDILLVVRNGSKNLIGKCALIPKENEGLAFGAFMSIYRSSINRFLIHWFWGYDFKKEVYKNLGATINSINSNNLKNFKLFIPSLQEQTKIANFLTEVDTKISQLKTKKEKLVQYKKGVMQKLFSKELRFKDDNGKAFPDWEEKKLGEVLFEHKLKSTGKEEVHSVSVHKGVVNQIEHLGRSFAAKDTSHYNRALPNDIIYTKSPTGNFPLGIIKQNHVKESVIISPLYGVFTPETKELGYILNVHFESSINTSNYLSSIIQKGAKNTINITNKTFLSKKIFLPISKKEQTIIGSFLMEIDTKINQVEKQLNKTEEFKKGLLQQMFV